ncbi:fimbrial protein, partial [Pseudomonas aeruginosa]|uniref:fimbrial protein n=2 Tax=Gammaproteobacteria TaxID=1236 RepID=UPI002119380B
TVALRQINAGAFKGDPTVGSTPFTMTLKAGAGTATCAKDKARLVVDKTASAINADGMITDTAGGSGTRTNAIVKFLDADNGDAAIDLTKLDDPALQRDKDTGGEFKYNWIARYHAPGGADLTEGDFSGRLVFDIDNY